MRPPFSPEQFFGTFVAYNEAVWPTQLLLLGVAVAVVLLAMLPPTRASRAIPVSLGILWIWMGVAYHWSFFARVNPAARGFAVLTVLEGVLLLVFAFRSTRSAFRPRGDLPGLAGGALVAYALVAYPLLGLAAGHVYPAQPTFGLPCPTTIFTVGLLLWSRPPAPWWLLPVPAAWSLVGFSAVRWFGVFEDAMLPVAALGGGALILIEGRRSRESGRAA